jgi:hypothetical protein
LLFGLCRRACRRQKKALILPPSGDSKQHAYFRVRPKRVTDNEKQLVRVRFRLFYKLSLLEVFTLQIEVIGSAADATKSALGLDWPVKVSPDDRLSQTQANDLDLLQPRVLHLSIEMKEGQYLVTFTLQAEGLEKIALVAPVRDQVLSNGIEGVIVALARCFACGATEKLPEP